MSTEHPNRDERYYLRMGQAKTPRELDGVLKRGRYSVGDIVYFPSGSSPTLSRLGKILACGPRRAKVSYKFYNGRQAEKFVPYNKLTLFRGVP